MCGSERRVRSVHALVPLMPSYTRDFLVSRKFCFQLPRSLRRRLFYFGILLPSDKRQCVPWEDLQRSSCEAGCVRKDERRIPTRITSRPRRRRLSEYGQPISRHLRTLQFVTKKRRKKRTDIQPSLLLANVRSLPSKMDELEVRLTNIKPDIIVLTESWLDSSLPDSAVELNNYSVIRKDRNECGGGIICYVSNIFEPIQISDVDVQSLRLCSSEFVAFYISSINLIVIAIYHPFWGDRQKNDEAIDCVTDIIDFGMTSLSKDNCVKVFLCVDFNDLRHSYDYISQITSLVPIVGDPTRGDHVLDQVFTKNVFPMVLFRSFLH